MKVYQATHVCLLCLGIVALTGCATGFNPREPGQCDRDYDGKEESLLAIGDSIFAWRMRTCDTVPDVAAKQLGRGLKHKAVNGAQLTGGEHPIVEQYEPGPWEWVIVDGGGNDLNKECTCGVDCDGVLDAMISEDGTQGEYPDLMNTILADGARVALYGYFRIDDRAYYGFEECRAELDVLHARQAKMADHYEGVIFVDAREVVNPEGVPEAYAFDHVHPSAKGAQKVGALIADKIAAAE